jgi:lysozyme
MKLNLDGYNLIKSFEGLKLKPYKCSAGIPTIGYGNTYYENGVKVQMSDALITNVRADELLKINADRFALKVTNLVHKPITQNQFNSLTSFAYNVGSGALASSTLLKLVNINPNDAMIAKEFLKWNKAGGKPIEGLTNRRIKESALYYLKLL